MDFFRKVFGFSEHNFQRRETPHLPFPEEPDDRFNHLEDNDIDRSRNGFFRGNFNVFTDPLEMHRYFEQQMDSMLKQFGMPNFGNFFHPFENPNLDEDNGKDEHFQHPRDQFIKRGYEQPTYEHAQPNQKIDRDLDGKLTLTDLDTLLQAPNTNQTEIVPKENRASIFRAPRAFGGNFFNQSVQVRTIRNPDGSYETHKTVTDSEGNQETTVTKKVGDKEYTILKKRDKDGKEEIAETMINITEEDKHLFSRPVPTKPFFDESLFNKFFK